MKNDLVNAIDDAAGAIRRADNRGGLGPDVHESLRRALACLDKAKKLATAEPERADVRTLERVRERLRGLYNETSPHNATASRMLFVIDDMLTEARARPAAPLSCIIHGDVWCTCRIDRMLTAKAAGVEANAAASDTAGEYVGLLRDLGVVAGLGVDPSPGLATRAAAALRKVLGELGQARDNAEAAEEESRRWCAEAGKIQQQYGQAEADLACERAITDQLVVSQLDRERASHERLIDVIAQETNAAGISDTMTPEERVRAVCGALARERDAHIRFSEERRAEVERLKAAIANAMQALGLVAPSPIESISAIGRELDDARAEVERLQAEYDGLKAGHGQLAHQLAESVDEADRLRAQLEPVRWDDVEGLCKVAWYATEVMASWEMLSDREREERRTEMRAVLSALARALLTEGALDAFVGAVIREPDRDITNLVTAGAGMRAALAHAGANVEAEPVAEGRACPWDDRRDNIRAAIRMVHQANEPHSSAIHGVTIALEQLALAVDEVRRLGGGGR